MRNPAIIASLAMCAAACAANTPEPAGAASTLFAERWNSGLSKSEPAFHIQAIDANTYAIRQSINATFEAPFIYLILGNEKALLIDTGDAGADLRPDVDRLIDASGRDLSLVVMHTHGHGDHVGGDASFTTRANTVVVGHAPADVAAFFGVETWPDETATFDLGGRIVEIIPTPGHHPSHVMVFDPATGVVFSGDAIYPGRLYFRCGLIAEYSASIDRLSDFLAGRDAQWLLGAHIEMRAAPGRLYEGADRARRDEHLLELSPAIVGDIKEALSKMGEPARVEAYDDFVLFPVPEDPRGKSPPDWCAKAD